MTYTNYRSNLILTAIKKVILESLNQDNISDIKKIQQVYKAYNYIFKQLYNLDLDEFFSPEIAGLKYANNKNLIFKYPLSQILIGMDIQKKYIMEPCKQLEQVLDHLSQHDNYYSTLKQTEKQLLNNNLVMPSITQRRALTKKMYQYIQKL